MSNIQFEDSNYRAPNYSTNSNSGMTNWLVKKGWVKNEAAAEIFLFIISIIFFTISAILFFSNNKSVPIVDTNKMNVLDSEVNNI